VSPWADGDDGCVSWCGSESTGEGDGGVRGEGGEVWCWECYGRRGGEDGGGSVGGLGWEGLRGCGVKEAGLKQ